MEIAIDFDGTIAEHCFPHIGNAVPGSTKWIKKFQSAGANLILWTMRCDGGAYGDTLTAAVNWCRRRGIHFWAINSNPEQAVWTSSPKALANIYVDDAAFGCPLVCPGNGRRPYVDWAKVGPALLELLEN